MSTKIYSVSGTEPNPAINYDTQPDLKNWGCTEWILYHQVLAKQVGKEKANEVWLYYFKQLSVWSSVYNWCKYKSEFSEYLKRQGIDVGNIFSDIYNAASSATKTAVGILNFGIRILPWAAAGYGLYWLATKTGAGRSATKAVAARYVKKKTQTKRKRK